jgi:hypothetical protein
MMVMKTELLDTAIATVKTAARDLPRDVEPADLSAQIAAARELAWVLDGLVKTLTARYEQLDRPLRHDQGGDPAAAVEMVRLRLDDIVLRLVEVDEAFGEAHNHAARIARA